MFVPQTGIIDYTLVSEKYAELVRKMGGEIKTSCKVTAIHNKEEEAEIISSLGAFTATQVINCAGLYSDKVAEMTQGKITENEKRVGDALIMVLDNWETIFEQIESGNKYNKNLILSYIRELSGLTTKDIRVSMRRYKKIYTALKNIKIDQGSL